jgi:hypothetical protein
VPPLQLIVAEDLSHRTEVKRKELVTKMGGSVDSESAVGKALAFLARNQEPDGRWTFINEDRDQPGRRPANRDDMGLTGLAMLCFLAMDQRPDAEGPYRKCVADGLAFLVARQKEDGDLRGTGGDMYNHGIAALAFGEAAVLTRDPKYGSAAVKAAQFIVRAQNASTGGWRYAPGEGGDTSVLGWQIMALHSVQRIGLPVPAATRAAALRWLASVSRSPRGMLAGYQSASADRTMTAEALFARLLLGEKLTDEQRKEAAEYVIPPDPTENPNFYYWYYGSLALMQVQGKTWQEWNAQLRDRIVRIQQTDGKQSGSWDPAADRYGADRGGRVYTTAIAALTLQVYYRYLPMGGDKSAGGRP